MNDGEGEKKAGNGGKERQDRRRSEVRSNHDQGLPAKSAASLPLAMRKKNKIVSYGKGCSGADANENFDGEK